MPHCRWSMRLSLGRAAVRAFKLIQAAQDHWRMVSAPYLVTLVRAGARFEHGVLAGRPEPAAA